MNRFPRMNQKPVSIWVVLLPNIKDWHTVVHIRMILHIIIVAAFVLCLFWYLKRTKTHDPSQYSPHIIKVVRPIVADELLPQRVDLPYQKPLESVPENAVVSEPLYQDKQHKQTIENVSIIDEQVENVPVPVPVPLPVLAPEMEAPSSQNVEPPQQEADNTGSLRTYTADEYTSLSKLYNSDKFMDQLRGMDMSSKDVIAGRQYDERFASILKTVR